MHEKQRLLQNIIRKIVKKRKRILVDYQMFCLSRSTVQTVLLRLCIQSLLLLCKIPSYPDNCKDPSVFQGNGAHVIFQLKNICMYIYNFISSNVLPTLRRINQNKASVLGVPLQPCLESTTVWMKTIQEEMLVLLVYWSCI